MKNLTIEKTLFVAILGLLPLCGCVNETLVPPQDMIELRNKAKKGDKSAQRNISERYATGNTLVQDEVLAEQWAMRASPIARRELHPEQAYSQSRSARKYFVARTYRLSSPCCEVQSCPAVAQASRSRNRIAARVRESRRREFFLL